MNPKRAQIVKHSTLWTVFTFLAIFLLVACAGGGSSPTPTVASTTQPTQTPFQVTGVDLSVTPTSIAGTTCGSQASFTYTAVFHLPAHTAGGTIHFNYTLNNGRSQTNGTVMVGPGETSQAFTFTSAGTLPPDHTYPGIATVMVTRPNTVLSPQVQVSGTCGEATPPGLTGYQVVSNTATVQPGVMVSVSCPGGLDVLGGGSRLNTRTILVWIAQSFPANNGWTVQYESNITSLMTVTVFAVCGK